MLNVDSFMNWLVGRNPGQTEFHEAALEIAQDVIPYINLHPEYERARILERMTEPDRIVSFRVAWENDAQEVEVNRGYRAQFNKALGPYKGGLRFDPSVSLGILKFLGLEQTFKNSLTTLPLGGAKGGADFNPKGRSDDEVMRFCQSYMTELFRHIGESTDIPAGDIGVGPREIGYLFGQYNRLSNQVTGVMTGKRPGHGGSHMRMEATGYGCVYFTQDVLARLQQSLEGKTCLVSGSGNVAQYTAEKLLELGAKVVTLSDRSGFIYEPEGLTPEKLRFVVDLKTRRRRSLVVYAEEFGAKHVPNQCPWSIPCDVAFPAATQDEIDADAARVLVEGGCQMVCEAANMPLTPKAAGVLRRAGVIHAPSKAANSGGVAVSSLEMTQNAMGYFFSRERVTQELQRIMSSVHEQCVEYGQQEEGHVDYAKGANIAGFKRVADAMLSHGVM